MSKYLLALPLLLLCAGCREDMQEQPKFRPLQRTWFYPDGRSARPIPPGTVATDEVDVNPVLTTGKENGAFVTSIPLPVNAALLERGRQRFNIYCAPCHGRTGNGDGMIAQRGFLRPANLNGERVRNAPPGYLYAVIADGYGAMSSYAYQIKSFRDRWAIVAYIRALELSRGATLNDVPPEARRVLEGTR